MNESGATRRIAQAVFGFFVIATTSYFGYSALQGDTGLVEQVRLAREQATLEANLAELKTERRRMENLTRRLSDRYLDLDLLDERARRILGYARQDEIVIR
ncbi:FtsB family cell division protein [Albimonas pacifica]|uniref:Cell division protein FtsB n=1 Tax=Albimonas pacifica TaxID=1114924 RepID=A0A1I3GMF6_9RHOB|nr:septum formation initiator family protein [Albimonas pacifica]SFI24624.1 Cell division protein FtsB [Albimonas pacifica]